MPAPAKEEPSFKIILTRVTCGLSYSFGGKVAEMSLGRNAEGAASAQFSSHGEVCTQTNQCMRHQQWLAWPLDQFDVCRHTGEMTDTLESGCGSKPRWPAKRRAMFGRGPGRCILARLDGNPRPRPIGHPDACREPLAQKPYSSAGRKCLIL